MNYPFVKCLEPKYIRNKYTNEPMIVGCGKCEACLSRKASMSTLKCRLESKMSIYQRFVTLTYNEDCVPRMKLDECYEVVDESTGIVHSPIHPYAYFENTGRLAENVPRVLSYCPSLESHLEIVNKVGHQDLPHLSKRDLQLFIKRLRKYISDYGKKNNIPIGTLRYYACGEYGPVHFRPHYHLILWYICDEIDKIINEAVYSCWSFGRVDSQIPRDDVTKYIAKYVNGNCRLPQVFKQPQTRPFSLHSQHLGESFFQATKKDIYEQTAVEAVRRCAIIADAYSEFNMWRSLEAYYFPRCKSFSLCTTQQRYEAYTIVSRVQEYTKRTCIAECARVILNQLYIITSFIGKLPKDIDYSFDDRINDMLHNIIEACDIEPIHLNRADYYEKAFRSLYMYLRTSKHFTEFVCDGDKNNYLRMVIKIENHYKDMELFHMNQQYQAIEDNMDEWFEDEDEYMMLYLSHDNIPNGIKQTKIYRRFKADSINRYNNSMKHKKLNDLNKVFENY